MSISNVVLSLWLRDKYAVVKRDRISVLCLRERWCFVLSVALLFCTQTVLRALCSPRPVLGEPFQLRVALQVIGKG